MNHVATRGVVWFAKLKMKKEEIQRALSLLGLSRGVDVAEVKRRYRELAKIHHPDVGGKAENFANISDAYQLLLQEGTHYEVVPKLTQESLFKVVRV